jgi:hypothetical protein
MFLVNKDAIWSGSVSAPVNRAISSVLDSLAGSMEEEFEGAFSRLTTIVEYSAPGSLEKTGFMQEEATTELQMYQRAIKMLRLCYIEESN